MGHKNYLKEAKQRHTKTYTKPLILIRALNYSSVFDVTTEAGRQFYKEIVLGEHHYRPYILYIVNHEMPWYFLSWMLGQIAVFIKRDCTAENLPKES